jgi:hypothetical protein
LFSVRFILNVKYKLERTIEGTTEHFILT